MARGRVLLKCLPRYVFCQAGPEEAKVDDSAGGDVPPPAAIIPPITAAPATPAPVASTAAPTADSLTKSSIPPPTPESMRLSPPRPLPESRQSQIQSHLNSHTQDQFQSQAQSEVSDKDYVLIDSSDAAASFTTSAALSSAAAIAAPSSSSSSFRTLTPLPANRTALPVRRTPPSSTPATSSPIPLVTVGSQPPSPLLAYYPTSAAPVGAGAVHAGWTLGSAASPNTYAAQLWQQQVVQQQVAQAEYAAEQEIMLYAEVGLLRLRFA